MTKGENLINMNCATGSWIRTIKENLPYLVRCKEFSTFCFRCNTRII